MNIKSEKRLKLTIKTNFLKSICGLWFCGLFVVLCKLYIIVLSKDFINYFSMRKKSQTTLLEVYQFTRIHCNSLVKLLGSLYSSVFGPTLVLSNCFWL